MHWFTAQDDWLGRLAFQRGLAVIYLVAFLAAARQFRGLLGPRGPTPTPRYPAGVSFRQAPSLFQLHYSDRFFATACWGGVLLAAALAAGLGDLVPLWAAVLLRARPWGL